MRTKLFALYAAVALVVVAMGPGVAAAETTAAGNAPLSVAVDQSDDGSVTVSVMANETGVENASVAVDAPNATYGGEGNYTTDENGTVGLPAPEETVTVDVTAEADNRTANTTATLEAFEENVSENASFGQVMSSFVHQLQESEDGPIGPLVAAFAVANNPGNAPGFAGPPAFLTDDDEGPPGLADENEDGNETTGLSQGSPENAGPPGDAGPPEDGDGDSETEDDEDRRGPPGDAGPPEDGDDGDDSEGDADDGEQDDEDEETETPDDGGDDGDDGEDEGRGNGNGDGNGNGRGPPN